MTEEEVLATAKERFEYAVERESHNVERQKEDIRFAASSPDDPWQWGDDDRKNRKGRPTLTINKMPQHIRQVTNDIRQNRPSIRYRPADDRADVEVADILMGLVRHIEAQSDADIVYDTAAENQVTMGLGYIRVVADYIADDSFDQDIYLRRIPNSFRVHLDPDAQDPAGSDAKWGFIDEELSQEDFEAQYPDADAIDWTFAQDDAWYDRGGKKVRVVEYFEIAEKAATLNLWASGATSFAGEPLPMGVYAGEKPIKTRKTSKCTCVWRKLNGQQILEGGKEGKEFPSKYIPIARAIGNEWEVDGKKYVSGIVRNAKDSQRMYNVAQSAIVERVMQAPKSPWVASADAIAGYEKTWQTANTANHAFLPYNERDEEGNTLQQPTRTAAASVESGLSQVAMGASDDIKSETGQYDASLGQKSNETSGRAIMARQREGDTATFHYVDNLGRAVRHIGRIILDMIPKVLDTRRVALILGEDGEAANAVLDPEQAEPLQKVKDERGDVKRIFNPNVGMYDVYTTTGPSFTTKRVEAVEAMTAMTQANPELWGVIGDLLVKNMDWPGAEDMAERLRATLNPAVQATLNKDEGEPEIPPQIKQAMEQMGQHLEQMQGQLQAAGQEVQKLTADSENKARELLIKGYDAETKRLQVLGSTMSPEGIQALVQQTLVQMLTTPDPAPPEPMGLPDPGFQPMPPDQGGAPLNDEPPPGGFSLPAA